MYYIQCYFIALSNYGIISSTLLWIGTYYHLDVAMDNNNVCFELCLEQ